MTEQIQSNAIRKSCCLKKKKYQIQPVLYYNFFLYIDKLMNRIS
jgi:hypothetical protein